LLLPVIFGGQRPRPSATKIYLASRASAQLLAEREEKLMIKVLAMACLTLQAIVGSAAAQQAGIKRSAYRPLLHRFSCGLTTQ